MRIPPNLTFALLIGLPLLLAGCTNLEPFQRPGTWHETNATADNIAAELVNPEDLLHGSGQPVLTGIIAESAVGSGLKTIKSPHTETQDTTPVASLSGNSGGNALASSGIGSEMP